MKVRHDENYFCSPDCALFKADYYKDCLTFTLKLVLYSIPDPNAEQLRKQKNKGFDSENESSFKKWIKKKKDQVCFLKKSMFVCGCAWSWNHLHSKRKTKERRIRLQASVCCFPPHLWLICFFWFRLCAFCIRPMRGSPSCYLSSVVSARTEI